MRWLLGLLLIWSPGAVCADEAAAIRGVLLRSVEDWNRGDIPAFMSAYEESPETTFVGRQVTRGHASVLADYRRRYPNREAMGTLRFSELEPRLLSGNVAIVTGRFHLTRTAAGGGDAAGIFSLVMRRGKNGWKIIHDHTS